MQARPAGAKETACSKQIFRRERVSRGRRVFPRLCLLCVARSPCGDPAYEDPSEICRDDDLSSRAEFSSAVHHCFLLPSFFSSLRPSVIPPYAPKYRRQSALALRCGRTGGRHGLSKTGDFSHLTKKAWPKPMPTRGVPLLPAPGACTWRNGVGSTPYLGPGTTPRPSGGRSCERFAIPRPLT